MTPFYIYLPLAVAAFALIDKRRDCPVKWVANLVAAVCLYGIVWFIHHT